MLLFTKIYKTKQTPIVEEKTTLAGQNDPGGGGNTTGDIEELFFKKYRAMVGKIEWCWHKVVT